MFTSDWQGEWKEALCLGEVGGRTIPDQDGQCEIHGNVSHAHSHTKTLTFNMSTGRHVHAATMYDRGRVSRVKALM